MKFFKKNLLLLIFTLSVVSVPDCKAADAPAILAGLGVGALMGYVEMAPGNPVHWKSLVAPDNEVVQLTHLGMFVALVAGAAMRSLRGVMVPASYFLGYAFKCIKVLRNTHKNNKNNKQA